MNKKLQKGSNIRIMSSNIWGNCSKETPIATRDDKIALVYRKYLPDVIGMQECSPKARAQELNLWRLIQDQYSEVPAVPSNELKNNYTSVVYRTDKFNLIDFGWSYYSGLNDKGSKSLTWCVLENKKTKKQFLFFNTHYYWTGDEPGKLARIENTKEFLTIFKEIYGKYKLPAFFTGDFNCRSDEPPIQALISEDFVESRTNAKIRTSKYRSHHKYPTYYPEEGTYHDGVVPNLEPERSIDHIFTYGHVETLTYHTVIDPESLEASDHCPIYIDAKI